MHLRLHFTAAALASVVGTIMNGTATAEGNSMQRLFEMADKLCLHRYQNTESEAYKQCRAKQSIAVARLVQGMAALPDQSAFEALYKRCLMNGPDMAAGFADFDDGLNCVVAQDPATRKVFFGEEQ
ncbi:hypothetical protein FJV83_31510 [Mesorhizobium sp. WSM4307]|uniref:hypothetical protein n=1 Tax=unclassified Mesorhizobium TaxID=325217 RepID=UPI00115E3D59|nr:MULTISPECIES: hypothetical protein [unclassified Mesorhizobium]TRC72052.1 hypothetical protein FJV81_30470 [Mesorhizobium sp. WSM4315]TRC77828.1 hypothetical protein FJV83_31510 [Mesorhizobium sp. WSM4307]